MKKKLALLAGLLVVSATSMAEFIPLEQTKGQTTFDIKNTRYDANGGGAYDKTEAQMNGIWLNDRNRLDIEWDHAVDGSKTGNIQFELFTQLSDSGRWELYTDFRPYRTDSAKNKFEGYLDVMPTFVVARSENLSSVLKAGLGYEWNRSKIAESQMRTVAEFKNVWTVNDWLELEANAYYTNYAKTGINEVLLEAYFYTNYQLAELDNGITITALFEGGADPYSFGEREVRKQGTLSEYEKTDKTYDNLYFYLQPTIKINAPLADGKYNVYLEPGYYADFNHGAGGPDNRADYDEGGLFVRVGFNTKF